MTVKWVWVVLGLVPAVLFVTGGITWWARVVRRRGAGTAVTSEPGEPAKRFTPTRLTAAPRAKSS